MIPKDTVVQLVGGILDKSIRGCLGVVLEDHGTSSKVGIYYPEVAGKNAFVKKYDILNTDLHAIGPIKLKPL